MQTFTKTATIN